MINHKILNIFIRWTLATGVLSFVAQEFILIFIPASISFFTGVIYFVEYYEYNKKMNVEKKQIEDYDQFYRTINKI